MVEWYSGVLRFRILYARKKLAIFSSKGGNSSSFKSKEGGLRYCLASDGIGIFLKVC